MSERGKRKWLLRLADYDGDEGTFRAAVADELAGLENIGHRLGGGFISSPIREAVESPEGLTEYVTIGWLFEHAFMPAVKRRPEPAPEPVEFNASYGEIDAEMAAGEPEPVEA
jgi:hypothetical protein